MKAKILLLSLATLLLGACQSENEPTEAFYLLQKSESMEERNEFVTNTTAAMIQINAPRYNCEIVETALGPKQRVQPRRTLRLPGYGIDCRDMDGSGCTISQQQPRNIYATLRSLQNPKGRLPRNR